MNHRDRLNFVLVHGAWHDATLWKRVAPRLRAGGHTVHTPTAAGHGPNADPDTTLQQAYMSIVDYVLRERLTDVVLLGWSFGGVLVQQATAHLAQHDPDILRRVVFHNAFVLADGECVYDTFPEAAVEYFKSITTAQGTIMQPFERVRNRYCAPADHDEARAIYDMMNPQLARMFDTPTDTRVFDQIVAAAPQGFFSYVNAVEDIAFPHGPYAWYPRFADRLGSPRVRFLCGHSHEAPLTGPSETANAYIVAGRD